ncbi:MAG: globin [Fuerstiella sp.]
MNSLPENQVYEIIGVEGFTHLVAAFYRRVAEDSLLRPMYPPGDLSAAEDRLRGFLIFRFGGPQTYIAERGHPRLRMRHVRFAVNKAARDRWMQLMNEALQEVQLPDDVTTLLRAFFEQVATFLINTPE